MTSTRIAKLLLLFALIAPFSAAQQHASLPRHTGSKTYTDLQYGVTFRYPADWRVNDPNLVFYGSSYLLLRPESERTEIAYDQFRAKVGQSFRIPKTGEETSGVAFVYAEFPNLNAAAYQRRATDSADDKPAKQVSIGGVRYTHVAASDAGLGHGWDREIYVTFLAGRCFGFEEQHDITHVDGWNGSAAERKAVRALSQVMQSVRIVKVTASNL